MVTGVIFVDEKTEEHRENKGNFVLIRVWQPCLSKDPRIK